MLRGADPRPVLTPGQARGCRLARRHGPFTRLRPAPAGREDFVVAASGRVGLTRRVTKTHVDSLPWNDRRSPAGRFQVRFKEVSLALGGKKNIGEWDGGHPFDLTVISMPPGATNYPYHSHAAQWEMYLVVSGTGTVRTPAGLTPIGPGDAFVCPPGEPHQIQNTGTTDLVYHVIADNPRTDTVHYPDSDKWYTRSNNKVFRLTEHDYYDGEE